MTDTKQESYVLKYSILVYDPLLRGVIFRNKGNHQNQVRTYLLQSQPNLPSNVYRTHTYTVRVSPNVCRSRLAYDRKHMKRKVVGVELGASIEPQHSPN